MTAAVARAWPGARVVFVARPPADEIARRLPGVTDVVAYDKWGADRGIVAARRLAGRLSASRPDLWLSLHGSLRSGLFAAASGTETIGPAGMTGSIFFRRRVPFSGLPFAERSVAIARAAGLPAEPLLQLVLSAEERAAGTRRLGAAAAVAVIPGSAWETKRWPAARVADLARRLAGRGLTPVLLGSPGERELCAGIAREVGACLDLCGASVAEALGVIGACQAAVGGDSGLVHAARAIGIPTAVLVGPTDPARLARAGGTLDAASPSRERCELVTLGLACSPCSEHGGRRCPLGHHRCLADLPAERVEAALLRLLES